MKFFSRILFAAALIGTTVFLLWFWSRNYSQIPSPAQDERGEVFSTPSRKDRTVSQEPSNEEPAFVGRETIIQEALLDFSALLLKDGASSEAVRFWFSSDKEFYVEYGPTGSGRAQGMVFVTVAEDGSLERGATFVLGENDWVLKEGDPSILFTYPRKELYEKNAAGEWAKIN